MNKQRLLIDNFVNINRSFINISSLLNVLGIKWEFVETDKDDYKGFLSSLQKIDGDIYPNIYVNSTLADDNKKIKLCIAYEISRYVHMLEVCKQDSFLKEDNIVCINFDFGNEQYFNYALDILIPFNHIKYEMSLCIPIEKIREWYWVSDFAFYRQMVRYDEYIKSKSIIGRIKSMFNYIKNKILLISGAIKIS